MQRVCRQLLSVCAGTMTCIALICALASSAQAMRKSFTQCPKVVLYSARGADSPLDDGQLGIGAPALALLNELRARLVGPNASGTKIAAAANEYPARLFSWTELTNAYAHSVEDGASRGLADLNELARLCPRAALVLSGYSEGADVIRRVMFDLSARMQRRVKAVVLYGDPFFDAREAYVTASGDYLPSQVGIWRQAGLAHHAIGARYRDETFSWCRRHDLVCQGVHAGNSPFAPHMSYEALATRGAADQVLSRLGGSIRVRIEDATNYDHVTPVPPYGSGFGPPLPGATITLQPAPYQPLARCDQMSVVSDAAGVATFTHCMPSRYLLASLSKPGYSTYTPAPPTYLVGVLLRPGFVNRAVYPVPLAR